MHFDGELGESPPHSVAKSGRRRVTTARDIQRVAVSLFAQDGYASTSIEDIAAAVPIGRTTFFRYFPTKSSVVWFDLEENLDRLTKALESGRDNPDLMQAVRSAVISSVIYTEDERVFLTTRAAIIAATPELAHEGAGASARWAHAVAERVRLGQAEESHPALADAVGFAVMGVATATLRLWTEGTLDSLSSALDTAIDAVAGPLLALLDADIRLDDTST